MPLTPIISRQSTMLHASSCRKEAAGCGRIFLFAWAFDSRHLAVGSCAQEPAMPKRIFRNFSRSAESSHLDSAAFLLLIALMNLMSFGTSSVLPTVRKGGRAMKTCCKRCSMARLRRPSPANAFQARRQKLAHVFYRFLVRFGVRHRHRNRIACIAATRRPRGSHLVDHGLSTAVHLGHVPARYDRGVVMLGRTVGRSSTVRKLFYNMTITFVSFAVALLIGKPRSHVCFRLAFPA